MEKRGSVSVTGDGGTNTTIETSVDENTTLGKRATDTRSTKGVEKQPEQGPPKKQRKKSTRTAACWDVFEIIPGGRVLDQYRSSLAPRMVEALVCAQDWLRKDKNAVTIEEHLLEIEKIDQELTKTDNAPPIIDA